MAELVRGTIFNVQGDDPAFDLLSNFCDYFQLGFPGGDDVWLEGKIIEGEFIFNGRLFMKDGTFGTIIDSFPKGPTLDGWSQRRRVDADGYELLDRDGETVFSYHIADGRICVIDVSLYTKNGTLALTGGQGGLVTRVPLQLGSGGVILL